MSRGTKKKGCSISRQATNGDELFVGDFVRTSTGVCYEVNRYGGLTNPVTGSTTFKCVTVETTISEEEYLAWVNKKDIEHAANYPAATLPVEAHAPAVAEEPEETIEEEVVEAPAPSKSLRDFEDWDLIDELKRRGFAGKLRKQIIVYQDVEL